MLSNLRPTRLNEVIGNEDVIKCIKICLTAAKIRNIAFPHTLFTGLPGCGKTTLAYTVANEMGSELITSNASTINSPKMILPYLAKIKENTVWLIDECHDLKSKIQDSLYNCMEDNFIDIGSITEPVKIKLPPFTLIGATTEAGKLNEPFRARFKQRFALEQYTEDELVQILKINRNKLDLEINNECLHEIARRSKNTPRLANSYLDWIKNYAVAHSLKKVGLRDVLHAFKLRKIDSDGLTIEDRHYINFMKNQSEPVGLETLEAAIGFSKRTIVNDIENYLIRKGIVLKTSKGRILSV